ncbi:unnamed protein product [Ectocarpus sp. 12 AP-2014]
MGKTTLTAGRTRLDLQETQKTSLPLTALFRFHGTRAVPDATEDLDDCQGVNVYSIERFESRPNAVDNDLADHAGGSSFSKHGCHPLWKTRKLPRMTTATASTTARMAMIKMMTTTSKCKKSD